MEIKRVEDYYDKIKEKYPDLETWEIEKILKHGFQSLYTLNNSGADVMIKSSTGFLMYFGKIFTNKNLWMRYSFLKHKIKLRINYLHKKPVWDGNYYFGLTEEDYDELIPKKRGRYKRKITFLELKAYKIREEACLYYKVKYLFKLTGEQDHGLTFKEKNYSTRNIELVAIREKNGKFKDING